MFDPKVIKEMYWDKRMSLIKIGEMLHTSHSDIVNIMKKNNIPRRTFKEARAIQFQIRKCPNREYLHGNYSCIQGNSGYDCEPYSSKCLLAKQKEIEMSEQPMTPEPNLLTQQPITTRGKTIEKMEIKKEKEAILPLVTIQARKNEIEQQLGLCDMEIISMEKMRQELESQYRGVLSGIHKAINKKQVELLDLNIQDRNETRETLMKKRNELVFVDGLLESIIGNKEIIESITDITKQLKLISDTLDSNIGKIVDKVVNKFIS